MNLYPPILESQAQSRQAGLPTSFIIPFTMPLATALKDIKHVQVLLRRQANMESWSIKTRPYDVPDKEVIYLPRNAISGLHATDVTLDVPQALYTVTVPLQDLDTRGFLAGPDNMSGETYTVQIRFGFNTRTYSGPADFATWRNAQVAGSYFGEWSNTQRIFVYAIPSWATSLKNMFNITLVNDPVAKIKWDYIPISNDPLAQVRLSYSWSVPDDYSNSFRSRNLDFVSHDAQGARASGEADLFLTRFASMTITLDFLTVNNTSMTYIFANNGGDQIAPAFSFIPDTSIGAKIEGCPIVGEETEDGVIGVSIDWTWTTQSILGYYNIYRIDVRTLETILLKTIYPRIGDAVGSTYLTTIKDYSVEMGAEYIYMANAYTGAGSYLSTIGWVPAGVLTPEHWNPPLAAGYMRQMNFQSNLFLTTKWQQLRLQGNVSVSNFQRNTNDQFIQTIGGEYPFYSRSAVFNYRTLSFQGLISFMTDTTNTFLAFKAQVLTSEMEVHLHSAVARYNQDISGFAKDKYYDYRIRIRQLQYYAEIAEIYKGINPITGEYFITPGSKPFWMDAQLWLRESQDIQSLVLRATELYTNEQISLNMKRVVDQRDQKNPKVVNIEYEDYSVRGPNTLYDPRKTWTAVEVRQSDRTNDIIYAERRFRDAVMKWASDGKPKLLRSETEGNLIVMLSNVSFSPFNNQRRLYNISATATEIAEYNLTNLIKYGLIPTEFEAFAVPNISGNSGPGAGGNDFFPGDDDEELENFVQNTHQVVGQFLHQQLERWTHDELLNKALAI